jgi:hypothetical protein
MTIDQATYTKQILTEFGMKDCKPAATPIPVGYGHGKPMAPRDVNEVSRYPRLTEKNYRALIGMLNYLANSTRPDISYAVSVAAQETNAPTSDAIILGKSILRYLKGTEELGLRYSSKGPLNLHAYSDASWGDDHGRRSTTGVLVKAAGGAIGWMSVRQKTVTLSTAEAEYTAACEAARSVVGYRQFMKHLSFNCDSPTILFCDSQNALSMVDQESTSSRRKHIDVKHHFIKEQVELKQIELEFIPTQLQQADIFTKALPYPAFSRLRDAAMGYITPAQLLDLTRTPTRFSSRDSSSSSSSSTHARI